MVLETFRDSLRPDELLLEYVLNEPASYCLAVARENLTIVSLAGRKRIEDLVDRYLSVIKTKQPFRDLAMQLYSLLLDPVPRLAKKLRLIIVADGKLHLLPFDSLMDSKSKIHSG